MEMGCRLAVVCVCGVSVAGVITQHALHGQREDVLECRMIYDLHVWRTWWRTALRHCTASRPGHGPGGCTMVPTAPPAPHTALLRTAMRTALGHETAGTLRAARRKNFLLV